MTAVGNETYAIVAQRFMQEPVMEYSPEGLEQCVQEQFGGDWRKFEEAAREFIENGRVR